VTRWLILDLCGPMMAFGGVAVDQVGPVRDFPALSMITGLVANALGLDWRERQAHAQLQSRLVLASVVVEEPERVTDMQNAQLAAADKGWTTRNMPEGRDGGTYGAPHRRARDYLADGRVICVLRLKDMAGPDLDQVKTALQRPARPLFLGRKPCLPSRPVLGGEVTGQTAHEALKAALLAHGITGSLRAQWPMGQGPEDGAQDLADLRNWRTGLHGGRRAVQTGRIGAMA
jgi:CRISPR system Cascade subunit CasD